jgi:hypothetical protein
VRVSTVEEVGGVVAPATEVVVDTIQEEMVSHLLQSGADSRLSTKSLTSGHSRV